MKRFNFIHMLLLLFLPLLLAVGFKAEFVDTSDIPDNQCMEQIVSFQAGEKLEYKVYYNWTAVWMAAGLVNFEVTNEMLNGKEVLHTRAIGKTLRRYSWIFKVYDVYDSFIDPDTYKPVRFVRDVDEGGYTKQHLFHFDHDKGEVFIDYIKRRGIMRRLNETEEINSCTYDLLSILYYTRNVDYSGMAPNDSIPIDIFMDGKLYPLHLRYLGKDTLKTDLGTFRCIKLSPLLIDGTTFEGGEGMVVWATDDGNRLPLLIESPLKVGSAKAYLEGFENLKYEMEAKLDEDELKKNKKQ